MKLIRSLPPLSGGLITKLESILLEKFDYPSIPDDYKQFLLKNNGGYVVPGYVEDVDGNNHTEEIVFDTPLKWRKINDAPVKPSLVFFFGVWLPNDMDIDQVEDENLGDLIASNQHSKYDFDVLPDRMMSIAKCSHPDAADMLCISLAGYDYGAVYFYYDMWYYPAKWLGSYYDDKEEAILQKYNIGERGEIDDSTPEGKRIMEELYRVPFVKVADSFSEFLAKCRVEKVTVY